MSILITPDGISGATRSGDVVKRIGRDVGMITGTITFDTSYPQGGEALTGSGILNSGTSQVNGTNLYTGLDKFFSPYGSDSSILFFEVHPAGGYFFVPDLSTRGSEKIKVLDPGVPPIVFEEKFDADSDSATLKYPAAHIDYIATEAAPCIPIFGGVTPATGQVAVAMGYNVSTGVFTSGVQPTLTFPSGEGSATTYCSYATQAWKDLHDNMSSACMTSGEETWGDGLTFTAGTPDNVKLGTDICAMTSITWNDGGTIKVPELLKDGGTPAATLETEIDFVKASTYGEVNHFATDAVDTSGDIVYYQYIKLPSSGFLYERFTNDEITDSSDDIIFTGNPLIYGSCGQIPMETSDKKCYLTSVADTVAATQGHFGSHLVCPNSSGTPTITMEAGTDDDAFPAWIRGSIDEIHTQPIEVPGADYSGLGAIRFKCIGRIRY